MQIWLIYDSTSSLRLPVLPSEFKITTSNNNTAVNINDFGELNMIGKNKLAEISISSFFPAQYYQNLCEYADFPDPYSCVNLINKWRTSGRPIRLIITNAGSSKSSINMSTAIESFEFGEQDGTHDVYYTLSLKGHPSTGISQSDVEITPDNYKVAPYMAPAGNGRTVSRTIPSTYTLKSDENIYGLAKRLTGNGQNWYKIYLLNALKTLVVPAGTVLQL